MSNYPPQGPAHKGRYIEKHFLEAPLQFEEVPGSSSLNRVFLYSALYEQGPEVDNWTLNYWTGSANNDDPEANIYGADGLFPRKGRTVSPGSLVDMVIKAKKPY